MSISTIKAAEQRKSWRIVAVLARTGPAISGLLGLGFCGSDTVGRRSCGPLGESTAYTDRAVRRGPRRAE